MSDRPEHRFVQEKRLTIVEELRDLGLAAAFSEELVEIERQHGRSSIPLNAEEAAQLEEADFVIVLVGSPGTHAEIAGLMSSRRVQRKSVVFRNESDSVDSYLALGPLQSIDARGAVIPYDDEDLAHCRVAQAAVNYALDMAESMRGTIE